MGATIWQAVSSKSNGGETRPKAVDDVEKKKKDRQREGGRVEEGWESDQIDDKVEVREEEEQLTPPAMRKGRSAEDERPKD